MTEQARETVEATIMAPASPEGETLVVAPAFIALVEQIEPPVAAERVPNETALAVKRVDNGVLVRNID